MYGGHTLPLYPPIAYRCFCGGFIEITSCCSHMDAILWIYSSLEPLLLRSIFSVIGCSTWSAYLCHVHEAQVSGQVHQTGSCPHWSTNMIFPIGINWPFRICWQTLNDSDRIHHTQIKIQPSNEICMRAARPSPNICCISIGSPPRREAAAGGVLGRLLSMEKHTRVYGGVRRWHGWRYVHG